MEIKSILDNYGIVGVISNYQNKINYNGKVKDINVKNINNALKMVLLDDSYLEKEINELTVSEYFKIELMSKLEDDLIIIGNLSNSLIFKDLEYIKKLIIKLNKDYNKKFIIIDKDVEVFINLVNKICVLDNEKNAVIYSTDNYFDNNLYEYVEMPKIVEFIKYINRDNAVIDETTDIYELIKDIYRRVS